MRIEHLCQKNELLSVYKEIASLSSQMLELASASQWDELIAMEAEYAKAVEKTSKFTEFMAASVEWEDALTEALQNILNNETELKRLLRLRMDELKVFVGYGTSRHNITQAYGHSNDHSY